MANRRLAERGQAIVEAALMMPILLLITAGAIDLGRVYFSYTTIVDAAREGAMCASLGSLCPGGPTAAASAEVGSQLPGGITTSVSGGGASGSNVTVTVQYNFQAVTTAILATTSFPLKASATMVVQ